MSPVVPLLLLSACFPRVGGDAGEDDPSVADTAAADTGVADDTDDSADTQVDLPPPTLTGVSPTDGTTAGGQEVTLTGQDLGEGTRVWFGQQEAEVVEVTDEGIVVETPSHASGPADVTVANGDAEDSLADAFTFWPDASGDTTALAVWYYSEDETAYLPSYTEGVVWVTEPANVDFWELWGDSFDACGGASPITLTTWDGGIDLEDASGEAYGLAWDADTESYRADFDASAFSPNTAMGVVAAAGDDGPAFATDAFFDAPSSFPVTSPDLSQDIWWYGGSMSLAWSGAAEDFVLLVLSGQEDSLYCVIEDDGSYSLSASDIASVGSGYAYFSLGRFRVSDAVRAHDNGVVQGAGAYFTSGWVYVF